MTNEAGEKSYVLTPDMTIRGMVNSDTAAYAVKNGIKYLPTGGVDYTEEEDHIVIDKWTERYWYITVPSQIAGKPVTVIGKNAFKNVGDLEDVVLPNTLKEIRSGAFMNSSARDMTIPASVEKIGSRAFFGSRFEASYLRGEFAVVGDGILCKYNGTAEEVVLPENVKRIGEDAFAYCNYVTSVTVPAGVTEICAGAFYKCTRLEKIELPDALTSIDVGAFTGCTSLKTVTTGSGIESISDLAFSDCTDLSAFYGYADSFTASFAKSHGYYFEALPEKSAEEVSAE